MQESVADSRGQVVELVVGVKMMEAWAMMVGVDAEEKNWARF